MLSPIKAPNANAHCERFIRTLQGDCLDRLWFVGERTLRLVLNEYVDHYHRERHHQGIGHAIIDLGPEVNLSEGRLVCRKRIGGLLNYYYREVA